MSRMNEARRFREVFGQEMLSNISNYGFIKKKLWNMQIDLIEEEAAEFLEAADELFADPENNKRRGRDITQDYCFSFPRTSFGGRFVRTFPSPYLPQHRSVSTTF